MNFSYRLNKILLGEVIIIVNLVRNNKSKHASEFVKKFERINVALSRARKLLIIIGCKEFFTNQDIELEKLDDQSIKHTKKLYRDIYDRCVCKIDDPFNSYFKKWFPTALRVNWYNSIYIHSVQFDHYF